MQRLEAYNPVKESVCAFHMPMGEKRMHVYVLQDEISAMVYEKNEWGWFGTGKPFKGPMDSVIEHVEQVLEGYKILHG